MRRPDPLEWLLIAATLLAVAVLGQAVYVSANASLVQTLTATVTASRAAAAESVPPPAGDAAATGDLAGAHAALDVASAGMAADIAEQLDRWATWLAVSATVLVVLLAIATVMRARQLRSGKNLHGL